MEVEDVFSELEEVKQEIFRGKVKNFQIAEHPSRFKGVGFEIHATNKWRPGEPLSNVDWNLSLRTWPREIYKIDRIETRNAPVVIVADVSPSIFVEIDRSASRFRLLLHLLGGLGFTANYFHDPVGVAAVSGEIEFYLRPRLGQGQILFAAKLLLEQSEKFVPIFACKNRGSSIFNKIKDFDKNGKKSGLSSALEMLLSALRRQCSIVILSDFSSEISGESEIDFALIETLSSLHNWNIIAIFLDDPREFAWRSGAGVVRVKNIETGQMEKVRASRADRIRQDFVEQREVLRQRLAKTGVDSTVLSFGDHFNQLSQFLSERRTIR